MARRKTDRSQPVSEKRAGENGGTSDGVADLLEGAETPESAPSPVEAVASGPAQSMPGSASDRETNTEPPSSKSAPKDLRKLAPRKVIEEPPRQVRGNSALERVISRGIDPGDTRQIEPVEIFRVVAGGRAMIDGRICTVVQNARVTRLTHNLQALRLQGIELALIERG